MKNKYIHQILFATVLALALVSCRKTFLPSTSIDEESALSTAGDIETATIGTYALFKDQGYVRSMHFLTEFPSDEIAQGQNSSDDLSNCYKYTHLLTSAHSLYFWQQSYKAASAANRIIRNIKDDASPDLLQLKGENLYIRAMMHFNLVRVFGRPYAENGGTSLGVPILSDDLTDEQTLTVSRSPVKDVYDFVIADLLKAADLMTVKKTNSFASKDVAYALLSRVYLYKGDNQKAIDYANMVIGSSVPGVLVSGGNYALLSSSEFPSYFKTVPDANKETIFAIRHMESDNRGWGAIGSMYYSGNANGVAGNQAISGWGEIYASVKYINFLDQNPSDLRHSFISTYKVGGVTQMNTKLSPNTPMHYMTKYNFQDGEINLSSPVYLRLAEMYLNRAEANAKLGNTQLALDDVNAIRTRATIPTYTIASVALAGKSALDVVLEEKWLELAFEGHRSYDLFRNGLPVVRNYPGTHSLVTGNVNQTIQPGDARVVFYIPQAEASANTNLQQNP
ncbi:MAG: RagB/SusD family nutrient uptake outer membrane protein [Niabella sp.]